VDERTFWTAISVALSIAVIIITAKIKRGTEDTFYASLSAHNFLFSLFFCFTIAILLVLPYQFSEPLARWQVIILVIILLAWGIPLAMTLSVLFTKCKLKGNVLTIPSIKFTKRYEYIDITKIVSISERSLDSGEGTLFLYEIIMSDGTSFDFDQGIENASRLFTKIKDINDTVHFSFDLHRALKEDSFIRKVFNLGTIITIPIYAVGFYMLLTRIF